MKGSEKLRLKRKWVCESSTILTKEKRKGKASNFDPAKSMKKPK